MEKHISQTDLQNFYSAEIKRRGKKNVEEIFEQQRERSYSQNAVSSIFLCHSHLDKTVVEKMVLFFKSLNISLYVDWMDNSMPATTNKDTASQIKDKIENCDKFIFLATYHALRSKWCNWELGLAYAIKGQKDFAVFPIESKSGKWAGNEYLNLYAEMKLETQIESMNINDIYIQSTDNTRISFEKWIEK